MAQLRLDLHDAVSEMPAVCMRCGEPATVIKTAKLWWHPAWVWVFIVFGYLPYWLVANWLAKWAEVQAPFCPRHQWHWISRFVVVMGSFLLFVAILVGALMLVVDMAQPRQDQALKFLGIGAVVLIVVWFLIFISAANTGIRAKEITGEEILLYGVSDEFVAAMEDTQQERRVRNRKRRRRAEDDEPRPRKKRPAADTGEDKPRPRRNRPPSDAFEE